ncbi:hypothetical protein BDV18DRAFT_162713 [Aspergillus unguis]
MTELLIPITGRGLTPHSASHWSFLLRSPLQTYGDILHVQPISLSPLWHQFDSREGVDISSLHAEGMVRIAAGLGPDERRKVVRIIRAEPAPRDGKGGSQKWVVDVLIALEVEELVRPGTADLWGVCVGKSAGEVKRLISVKGGGGEWVDTRPAAKSHR